MVEIRVQFMNNEVYHLLWIIIDNLTELFQEIVF